MSAAKNLLIVGVILLGLITVWFFCACGEVRIDQDFMYTGWRIKAIGLAFHNYHQEHGQLPPAVVTGKDGTPLYSWRVVLLPFLKEEALYRRFKLEEPWDSPHNQQFLKETPYPFRVRADPGLTHFQVITGPGTAFERPGFTWKKDFPDGLDDTFLVVEARDPVPWTKPVDLTFDPNGPLPAFSNHYKLRRYWRCLEVSAKPGFVAGLADASCRFIPSDTDEDVVRAMITRNGGENVGAADVK